MLKSFLNLVIIYFVFHSSNSFFIAGGICVKKEEKDKHLNFHRCWFSGILIGTIFFGSDFFIACKKTYSWRIAFLLVQWEDLTFLQAHSTGVVEYTDYFAAER